MDTVNESIDENKMLASLGVENPHVGERYPEDGTQALSFDSPFMQENDFDNQKWLTKVAGMREEFNSYRSLNVVKEIVNAKRRTLQWLDVLGYQGVLALWRNDPLGLSAVIKRFEDETDEDFNAALVLDFMESHDSWNSDLEDIYRTHAFLHEAGWQKALDDADDTSMVSVALAKEKSKLMFERAGTLNREKFSRVIPQDNGPQGNIINVIMNQEGQDQNGPAMIEKANRQQLTAKARVKYGTGQYINPPGLAAWQNGDLEIPESQVDDYLMLKWVPPDYTGVIPEEAMIEHKLDRLDASVEAERGRLVDLGNL